MKATSESTPLVESSVQSNDNEREEAVIREMLGSARQMLYAKDQEITIKADDARSLYFVEKGAVEVSYHMGETKIVVALIGAGNFFGEIGFFDGVSRVRDIRTTEDTIIRVMDQSDLSRVQRENPTLYGKFVTFMAKSICAKFRRVLEEREPLTAYAASLSTGRRSFEESKPLPPRFFSTPEWLSISRIVEEFKAGFFDLSYQLQRDSSPDPEDLLQHKCLDLLDAFNRQLEEFNDRHGGLGVEHYAWGYTFKEIFPYFMRSRFAERAYYKPRGYAGDYLMMEMIYKNEPEGDGRLGTLVDTWCLNTAPAKAVRGRRKLLREQLELHATARIEAGAPVRIMNLASGPSRELFDFLSRCPDTGAVAATCIDADPQALAYTDQNVNNTAHQALIRLMNDNVVKWSLGAVRHEYGPQDIIYSAGLTDYLDRRLFHALIERCHEYLSPGGILIIGNFTPKNHNRVIMDHVLHWKLIYRDQADLEELFAGSSFGVGNLQFLAEEEGVNLFAVAAKDR
jgi:extracellular factor (EF) 3-hydroxypalmitic acid methyl ester biosynthesis protein